MAFGTNDGRAFQDYRIDSDEPLPFDGVRHGSSLILIDKQNAGMLLFSKRKDSRYDENGRAWTRGDVYWTP